MQSDTIAALAAAHHFPRPRLSSTAGFWEFMRKSEQPLLRVNDPPAEYSSRIFDGHRMASSMFQRIRDEQDSNVQAERDGYRIHARCDHARSGVATKLWLHYNDSMWEQNLALRA
jgi:hypothetical protein